MNLHLSAYFSVVADKQFCRCAWVGCSQRKNGLSILGWWVCQPLIKAVSRGSFMVLGFILEPSFDDMMLHLHMKRQIPKQKNCGQSMSMLFTQSKRFQLLSVNTGISERASQWLRGVCSFNVDFQRLPKVCRRSNEASWGFFSMLIFNIHWLKLALKSWWSA